MFDENKNFIEKFQYIKDEIGTFKRLGTKLKKHPTKVYI